MMIFSPRRGAALAVAALLLLPLRHATADTVQPRLLPTRDVDVTYEVVQNGHALPQRIRWSAAARLLRVDPPIPGMFVVVDYDRKHMSLVREPEHAVLDMTAPDSVMTGLQNRLDTTTRGSDETVAGLPCTNWRTTDPANKPASACITQDGVLLQVRSQDRVVLKATSVRFAPQDAALFRIPDGFTRVPADNPPVAGAR
ncbi:MAG: hypothetical protein JOZ42_10600 [Acetobacteraceae bacterium]|nr:hypothetical protein [Acetobacteraceae bacterium]